MKTKLVILFLGVFIFGYINPTYAQEILPEVEVVGANYKYLNSVDARVADLAVKQLQRAAAKHDLRHSDYYEVGYHFYLISFESPTGHILATYDKDGKLMRTAEKYKGTNIPYVVRASVEKKYPEWRIAKDVYLVSYNDSKGAKRLYKMLLEKGNERVRIKTNEKGVFL